VKTTVTEQWAGTVDECYLLPSQTRLLVLWLVRETTGCPQVSSLIWGSRLFFGHVTREDSRQDYHIESSVCLFDHCFIVEDLEVTHVPPGWEGVGWC